MSAAAARLGLRLRQPALEDAPHLGIDEGLVAADFAVDPEPEQLQERVRDGGGEQPRELVVP
jgi:hypothetical protein